MIRRCGTQGEPTLAPYFPREIEAHDGTPGGIVCGRPARPNVVSARPVFIVPHGPRTTE
ncbi:MAG: hypothetical protein AAF411_23645 [Myxococcota bacterium]